jgi:hypothetical protein
LCVGRVVVFERRCCRDICLEGMIKWRETSASADGVLGRIKSWGAAGYEALTCPHNVRSPE